MKVFLWHRIKKASDRYHSEGGLVVFAESEERARELASAAGASIRVDEKPNEVRDVGGGDEKVFIMPDAGCC